MDDGVYAAIRAVHAVHAVQHQTTWLGQDSSPQTLDRAAPHMLHAIWPCCWTAAREQLGVGLERQRLRRLKQLSGRLAIRGFMDKLDGC
jgi:hypothetical protein